MIDDYKSKDEWKIQITMGIIFVSFIDKNETQVMHTKSDNIEIMIGTDTSDTINELIDFFMKRYQEGLETKTVFGHLSKIVFKTMLKEALKAVES